MTDLPEAVSAGRVLPDLDEVLVGIAEIDRGHAALGVIALRSPQFDRHIAGRLMSKHLLDRPPVISQKSPEPGVGLIAFGVLHFVKIDLLRAEPDDRRLARHIDALASEHLLVEATALMKRADRQHEMVDSSPWSL